MICGDSYAGYLVNRLHDRYMYDAESYVNPGHSVLENEKYMVDAVSSGYKYILFAIGVNDHIRQTSPSFFKKTLMRYIDIAKEKGSTVYLFTYMHYPMESRFTKYYTTYDYDVQLMNLALENDFVHYIDLSECANNKYYVMDDDVHYNPNFYDLLLYKLIVALNTKGEVVDDNNVLINIMEYKKYYIEKVLTTPSEANSYSKFSEKIATSSMATESEINIDGKKKKVKRFFIF